MAETKARKFSGKELVWYIIAGVFALAGLVFIVFALIGDYTPGLASDNWGATSESAWLTNWSPLGYRQWGLILIAAGVLISAIALNFFAREGDRDEERALRRAQRLALENEAVDAEVESK